MNLFLYIIWRSSVVLGFPGGASGKEPPFQCRRCKICGFNPWVRKMPWRRAQQLTPILLPGESSGQPGRLKSLGSQRVRHDWNDLACSPVLFFCLSLAKVFSTPFAKRDCLSLIVYLCILCHRLIAHVNMGLFLGSLFCSVDLCVFSVPVPYCFDYSSFIV